ncbi:MAG: DapH/DapD/GlmU-related protein [Bacteroidota bacterium]
MDKDNRHDIFDRLRNDEPMLPGDPEGYKLLEASYATIKLTGQLNRSSDPTEIRSLLAEITVKPVDESVNVFPPLHINSGRHLCIGKNVFINFGCTILGLGGVTIEDNVLIAPNVSLLSEGHPLAPQERHTLVCGHIHIKKNAWIGAGSTILPGVAVGENAVVAAGALVTKDVPDNSVVAGIPAKVIKYVNTDN